MEDEAKEVANTLYSFLKDVVKTGNMRNTVETRELLQKYIKDFLELLWDGKEGEIPGKAFEAICDYRNNTADIIDQNKIAVDFCVQPDSRCMFKRFAMVFNLP